MKPEELYDTTPREYTNMIKGFTERQQQVYEQKLRVGQWTAWHIAAYVGSSFGGGDLPDLNDILTKPIFKVDEPLPPELINLTEEQKYNKSRTTLMIAIQNGIPVSEELRIKYNLGA